MPTSNIGVSAPVSDSDRGSVSEHFVQFYESDAYLQNAVGEYIGAALTAGDAAVVVATEEHRLGIESYLQSAKRGHRGGAAAGQIHSAGRRGDPLHVSGRWLSDPARFAEVVGGIIAQAGAVANRLRVFGEMVALLALDGNLSAVVQLEKLWNRLRERYTFSLFCAYPMDRLDGEALGQLLKEVCDDHCHVIPAESYAALTNSDDQLRAITVLQQKAAWLEAEIRERERAEARLRAALTAEHAAREEAEAALHARDEFLSAAAHELKTPITSLSGFAQLAIRNLKNGGTPEQVARALGIIQAKSDTLTRLLTQLLDISQLESGSLMLNRRPTDLVQLVTRVVGEALHNSDKHAIALVAPSSLEATVDLLRLEQVLTNLLDNAVKYSPEGCPIEVVLTQSDESTVQLSVRDQGLGIPPDRRAHIFERFYQAHTRTYSGWGLGLHISRQIVELHGGEIRVDFPDDGGTRFLVSLRSLRTTPSQSTGTEEVIRTLAER